MCWQNFKHVDTDKNISNLLELISSSWKRRHIFWRRSKLSFFSICLSLACRDCNILFLQVRRKKEILMTMQTVERELNKTLNDENQNKNYDSRKKLGF